MLQTNLIYGIQKKIKEGKTLAAKAGILEESTIVVEKKEVLLENYYNPGIAAGISVLVKDSQKKTAVKGSLMTEAFHLNKVQKKLTKDITYFNYLYENFVPEVFQSDYQVLLEGIFEDTIRLYQECDVTPRVISPAIDSNELNESQVIDLYKNALNHSIKENYTKPLLSGKISELFESEIKILTKKLLEENVVADANQIRIFLPFEETLYRFNREVLIPRVAESRMSSFMESTTSEYTDLLEESAEDILRAVEKKIKLLTSMISPGMFDKAVDTEGVDAPKMAGVSITVDKNFNDDAEVEVESFGGDDAEVEEEYKAEEEAQGLEDDEAEETAQRDDGGSDIVSKEAQVRQQTGLADEAEDYETKDQEDQAELSPTEAAGEEEQPGAMEADLPMADSNQDTTGYASNTSDVSLSGNGNDNGEDAGACDATLPGNAVAGSALGDLGIDAVPNSDEEVNTETPSEEQVVEIDDKENVDSNMVPSL